MSGLVLLANGWSCSPSCGLITVRPWGTFEHIRKRPSFLGVDAAPMPGAQPGQPSGPGFSPHRTIEQETLGQWTACTAACGTLHHAKPSCDLFHLVAGKPARTMASVNEFTLLFGLQIISSSKWCFLVANLKNAKRPGQVLKNFGEGDI